MYSKKFVDQVRLLLQVLPVLREQKTFALKGGTGINFFVVNMPRLSVDIDLTYSGFDDRETSLKLLHNGLQKIKNDIHAINSKFKVIEQLTVDKKIIRKLLVNFDTTSIKIEPNYIMRGTLYQVKEYSICKKVEEDFGIFIDKIPMVAPDELYAGKICAALNRQHPRDLFDIKLLLENGGITDAVRQAFVIYLACNPRPISELLAPNILDIKNSFEQDFLSMTNYVVNLEELVEARDKLINIINKQLTQSEKEFLFSIKTGEPKYELMPFENLDKLPALQWKLMNIKNMDRQKTELMQSKLAKVLGM
ncbi:MAG: nucleotidyl transferase AbiEii/AbiGii toxin family protein [Rickettsiaceae bacterium]|nr:nucleotidyl transferase AbiEii/AbiGii toxin family protein [Rickettsiaceae bacterium]